MFNFVAVIIINMMLLWPYLFIDTSLSKHVDMFFDFGFRLRTSEVYAWGSWYVHFASCFLTIIYNVFIHNNAFWSNSNDFSLIIFKVHTKRQNSGSWKSGPEKTTTATYSAQLQMSWNFTRIFMEYLRNIGANNY